MGQGEISLIPEGQALMCLHQRHPAVSMGLDQVLQGSGYVDGDHHQFPLGPGLIVEGGQRLLDHVDVAPRDHQAGNEAQLDARDRRRGWKMAQKMTLQKIFDLSLHIAAAGRKASDVEVGHACAVRVARIQRCVWGCAAGSLWQSRDCCLQIARIGA